MTIAVCILAVAVVVLSNAVIILNVKIDKVNKKINDLLDYDVYTFKGSYERLRPYAAKHSPYDTTPTFIKSIGELMDEITSLRRNTYMRWSSNDKAQEAEEPVDGDD